MGLGRQEPGEAAATVHRRRSIAAAREAFPRPPAGTTAALPAEAATNATPPLWPVVTRQQSNLSSLATNASRRRCPSSRCVMRAPRCPRPLSGRLVIASSKTGHEWLTRRCRSAAREPRTAAPLPWRHARSAFAHAEPILAADLVAKVSPGPMQQHGSLVKTVYQLLALCISPRRAKRWRCRQGRRRPPRRYEVNLCARPAIPDVSATRVPHNARPTTSRSLSGRR